MRIDSCRPFSLVNQLVAWRRRTKKDIDRQGKIGEQNGVNSQVRLHVPRFHRRVPWLRRPSMTTNIILHSK